ncbi:SDR family oxidoreductase [Marinivivus vitaminiproducens]|uniref:SDR family oxidoreductase n=1 Tax=Marinivivus vitaminiproducens TaxID=3035935 RepID=UPI0027A916C3|nr:SDR family oxidoreductase [Geminicoccaceae bacterium SCSIO 64248]
MRDDTTASIALVTGAARRLGRAMALHLAGRGYDIAVHYGRSADEARALAQEIAATGRRAVALEADLADEDAAQGLVPAVAERLGAPSLLVNSAALFERDGALDATRAGWDRHMAVNLRAPFVLTQAFARALPPEREGLVVNLIDQRVWNLTPNYTSYSVSKVALWGLTRHLALALAPRIRVNAIGPGLALAPDGSDAEAFRRFERSMPLGRGTTPGEIARALDVFIDSPSITGQMLALDGGQHLGWLPGRS